MWWAGIVDIRSLDLEHRGALYLFWGMIYHLWRNLETRSSSYQVRFSQFQSIAVCWIFNSYECSVSSSLHAVLDIERCDLDIKNNSRGHHTDLFGEERLIVRRGQPFNIIVHLKPGSKQFKPGETSFMLIVETGKPLVWQWLGTRGYTCVWERNIWTGLCMH